MHRVAEENIHFCLADRKTSSIGDEEATGGFEVILRDFLFEAHSYSNSNNFLSC